MQPLAEKLSKMGNVHFIERYNEDGKNFAAKKSALMIQQV